MKRITSDKSPAAEQTSGVTPKPAAKLSHREILTVMSGLIIAMMLAQLDNMIVSPALPTIVGDLGGVRHLAWVTTAYILASTAATPIWAKLGDLYGRRGIFLSSITIFLIGSILCGASQNMAELIGFRAIQGLGAGGLMVGIVAIIGEMVPPRERGRYQGIMMAVMPVSMIAGPLTGGFITDHASWRWAFYVNIPLGIVALAVVWKTLRLPKRHTVVKIDWWGAATLTVWITALVLVASWGGTEYPWLSWQIGVLAAIAVVGFGGFLAVERKAVEPVIPLKLFTNRNFTAATVLSFIAGFAMFGGLTFLPQYQQFVQGASATNSGLLLLPLMAGALTFSLGVGQAISRTGRYRVWPIVGTGVMAIGLGLMATLGTESGHVITSLYMVVVGIGIGCLMQTSMLITQNSVELRDIGAASGASTFMRNMGGSLGIALLGSLYTSRLTGSLADNLGSSGDSLTSSGSQLTPESLRSLAEPIQHAFAEAVTSGMHVVFGVAALVAAVGFGVAWFIREVPLRGSTEPKAPAEAVAERVPVEAGAR